MNALATESRITPEDTAELREKPSRIYPDSRESLETERFYRILRAQAEAGRAILDAELRTAYIDGIPRIPDTLKGQRLSPLVTRLERTGPLTRFEHLNSKFDGLPWLIDDVTVFPFPRGARENIPWDLRSWVNDQKHYPTDQNLFNDARYARDKMRYVSRRPGQKFKGYKDKFGKPTVYGSGDGADGKDGNTAVPASIHRENRGFGAQVVWTRVDETNVVNFPGLRAGDPIPVIAYASNSANARDWDLRVLATAAYYKLLERRDLDSLVKHSDEYRMLVYDYNADLDFEIRSISDRNRSLQRQRDSAGYPLYFPFSTDNEYDRRRAKPYFQNPAITLLENRLWVVDAAEVDNLAAVELQELREIWEVKLKDAGIQPFAVSEFPVRLLKETTQAPQDLLAEATIITDGVRLKEEWGMITPEQKTRDLGIRDKLINGDPLTESERQRKHEMLTEQIEQNELWHQAELRLRQAGKATSGLYALVKLSRKAPKAYFLMGEPQASAARARILAAQGDYRRAPYALVTIEQARRAAAARVKGKDGKAVLEAFDKAPLRILSF